MPKRQLWLHSEEERGEKLKERAVSEAAVFYGSVSRSPDTGSVLLTMARHGRRSAKSKGAVNPLLLLLLLLVLMQPNRLVLRTEELVGIRAIFRNRSTVGREKALLRRDIVGERQDSCGTISTASSNYMARDSPESYSSPPPRLSGRPLTVAFPYFEGVGVAL